MLDIAVAGFAITLSVPLVREAALVSGAPVALAVTNGVIHAGSLAARRLAPVWVVATLGVTAVIHVALGLVVAFLGPSALIGVYTVASLEDRRVSVPALGGAVGLLVIGTLAVDRTPAWDSLGLYTVLLCAAWWLGDMARRRQIESALHAERAEQLQEARLELARHAVTEERLRIARELHDVIVHSLTAVSVHAGTARLALDTDIAAAGDALRIIERATRATLGELRQLLTVLRDPGGPTDPSLVPSPQLDRLPDLVAESVDAGLAVEVLIDGDLTRLSPGLHLTAYRIVQESLTNIRQHAAAERATVNVRIAPAELAIVIDDDGRRREAATSAIERHGLVGTGHGLVGMRERVAIYGGELRAGPRAGGGFRVDARIPLGPEST